MIKKLHLTVLMMLLAVSVSTKAVEVKFTCKKTNWSSIGSAAGEVVGEYNVTGATKFDHVEAEIRCAEDPEQFIPFSYGRYLSGSLTCFSYEGGNFTLNRGYHYTLTVGVYDVPYYGAKPVATCKYEFVGTGAAPTVYCDASMNTNLKWDNEAGLGWRPAYGNSFDITFSENMSRVKAWVPMGQDGDPIVLTCTQKSPTKWTIILPSLSDYYEVDVQAWNASGLPARTDNSSHIWAFGILPGGTTGIEENVLDVDAQDSRVYNIAGQEVKSNTRGILIKNGKKYINK